MKEKMQEPREEFLKKFLAQIGELVSQAEAEYGSQEKKWRDKNEGETS